MVNHASPLQKNAFSMLQSPIAASFTPLQTTLGIAHGDLGLVCVRLLGHGNPFHDAPAKQFVRTFLPEAVWNSVVSVATGDRQSLRSTALGGPVL